MMAGSGGWPAGGCVRSNLRQRGCRLIVPSLTRALKPLPFMSHGRPCRRAPGSRLRFAGSGRGVQVEATGFTVPSKGAVHGLARWGSLPRRGPDCACANVSAGMSARVPGTCPRMGARTVLLGPKNLAVSWRFFGGPCLPRTAVKESIIYIFFDHLQGAARGGPAGPNA